MRRVLPSAALGLLALAGCAHRPGPDGKPASSVPWCARGPVAVRLPDPARHAGDKDDLGLAPYVRPCMRVLDSVDDGHDIDRTLFGLTTNEHGVLVGVCLLGTTLPPTAVFLECVTDELRRGSPVLRPRMQEEQWSLVTVFD